MVPTSWLIGRPTGVVDEVRVADRGEGRVVELEEERDEDRGVEREVRDGIPQS